MDRGVKGIIRRRKKKENKKNKDICSMSGTPL